MSAWLPLTGVGALALDFVQWQGDSNSLWASFRLEGHTDISTGLTNPSLLCQQIFCFLFFMSCTLTGPKLQTMWYMTNMQRHVSLGSNGHWSGNKVWPRPVIPTLPPNCSFVDTHWPFVWLGLVYWADTGGGGWDGRVWHTVNTRCHPVSNYADKLPPSSHCVRGTHFFLVLGPGPRPRPKIYRGRDQFWCGGRDHDH